MGKVKGLKVEDLAVGEIYECLISFRRNLVLVIQTEPKTVIDADGKETSISVKAGKIAIMHDSGDMKYILIELHDGQLAEFDKAD
jgi:hypothetical protein